MRGHKINQRVAVFSVFIFIVVAFVLGISRAEASYDIRADSITFIPDNNRGQPADEVPQGRKGQISAVMTNLTGNAVNVQANIEVDGRVINTVTVNNLLTSNGSIQVSNVDLGAMGEHAIRLVVDPQNQITETNENNNSISRTVRVVSPYDIRAEDIHFVSDGQQNPANEVAVGTKGRISLHLVNLGAALDSIQVGIELDGRRIDTFTARNVAGRYLINTLRDLGGHGEHTLRLIVDPANQISENNENNNTFSRTVKVVSPYDLKAESIVFFYRTQYEPVSEITACAKGSVLVRIRNVTAVSTNVRAVIEVDGKAIKTITQDNMAALYMDNLTTDVDLGLPGNHVIRLVVDPQNQVSEIDETNNVVSCTVKVNPRYDFLAEWFVFYPGGAATEGYETLTNQEGLAKFMMDNVGDVRCYPVNGQIALKSDGKVMKTWSFIDSYPNFSDGIWLQWSTPGIHEISVVVDPDNQIAERDETNNVLTRSVNVLSRYDFEALTVYFRHETSGGTTDVIPYGQKCWIEYNLKNNVGNQPEIPVDIGINLDGQRIYAKTISTTNNPDLRGGPTNVDVGAVGRHTLTLVVDPENKVAERNEANNQWSRTVTVTSIYDIKADSIEFVPNEKQTGDKRDEFVVGRKGTISAKMTNLTSQPVNVQAAVELDGKRIHTATRNTLSGTTNIYLQNMDLGGVGSHTLRLVVDPANQVAEQNENNNLVSRTIQIVPATQDRSRGSKTKEDTGKKNMKVIPEESAKRDVLKAPDLKPAGK